MGTGGGATGVLLKNGTWNGIMGDLMNGISEVGICAGISLSRYAYVDFSYFFNYLELVLSHGPTPRIYTWKALLWPFSQPLWNCIVIHTALAITFLLVLERYLEPLVIKRANLFWGYGNVISFILSSFLFRYVNIPAFAGRSTKAFCIVWSLCVLTIVTVYLSRLFSLFVSPRREISPGNLNELATSDYDIGMTYFGGLLFHTFKSSPRVEYKRIFSRWSPLKPNECLERGLKPKFACLSYNTDFNLMLYSLRGDIEHLLTHKRLSVFEIPMGLPLEKNSIYSRGFHSAMSSTFECGLLKKWVINTGAVDRLAKTGIFENGMKQPNVDPDVVVLSLLHLKGALYSFVGGVSIALITFTLELLLKFASPTMLHFKI
ncbi:unnamed protein product [Allacma fusca]|uniref:Ionotropic glutamate receptor C-terminal domain-containing protein n=1 Tax=Allacma fusca TaxID=39272 RepID=A0A8J2KDX6_9HEXA|nr:unnamed protein product [Allacma fusca]